MQNAKHIASKFEEIHKSIYTLLEKADGKGVFKIVPWEKSIGKGCTCVLTNGGVIEKAGVNFSNVQGEITPQMEKIIGEKAGSYSATGISSIIHPINPFMPIIHMNVRYFELDNGTCWFGGGIDLTPHYIDNLEACRFHKQLADICNKYDSSYYNRFKTWADDYFFIKHRNETRGIGGIFFDRLQPDADHSLENFISFATDLATAYPNIYSQIMSEKSDINYGDKEKEWQKIRRGRYVEFNLLYDRGTKFGLESGGNIESILISLPPEVIWEYDQTPIDGSREWQTMQMLKKDIDWLNK